MLIYATRKDFRSPIFLKLASACIYLSCSGVKWDLKSIELLSPITQLSQDEKGNITSFGFNSDKAEGGPAADNSIASALTLFTSENAGNPIRHLKSFIIRHASLSVKDSKGKAFLASSDAEIEITRKHETAEGRLIMPLQFGGGLSKLTIGFQIDGQAKTVRSDIAFKDVPSEVLYSLAPTQKWMEGVKVPLSGKAAMASDFDANINAIDFALEAGQGTITFPDEFEKTLETTNIKVSGSLTDQMKTLTIKEGLVAFKEHQLSFNGKAYREGEEYGVDGYVESNEIDVDKVRLYWPLKLAPHSRHWVNYAVE